MIAIKRAYDPVTKDDGFRILVDRLWPRGLSKEKAHLGLWLKDIAPSTPLRQWFSHDPSKWPEFQKRYQEELRANKELLKKIKDIEKKKKVVTLIYSAKDENRNDAIVLRQVLGYK